MIKKFTRGVQLGVQESWWCHLSQSQAPYANIERTTTQVCFSVSIRTPFRAYADLITNCPVLKIAGCVPKQALITVARQSGPSAKGNDKPPQICSRRRSVYWF